MAQVLATAFGIWLTAAPDLLDYSGRAAIHDHIFGPIMASCAFVAIWAVMRAIRWVNVVLGGWLLFAPWLLEYQQTLAVFNSLIIGFSVMGLSFIKGTVTQRVGGGWSALLPRRGA